VAAASARYLVDRRAPPSGRPKKKVEGWQRTKKYPASALHVGVSRAMLKAWNGGFFGTPATVAS
jgi:hypothetical protein